MGHLAHFLAAAGFFLCGSLLLRQGCPCSSHL
jgi:hypothetical protein